MNNKIRCAILGANGYLGQHLSLYLREKGVQVFNYDIQKTSTLDNYKTIDITDNNTLNNIDWDIDYLYVFSGLTGTKIGFEKYSEFIQVNEIGFLNVLNKLTKIKSKPHIVFPSTRLVYKGADHPLKEDEDKNPLTIYAINKLACEHYLNLYYKLFDIPYTVFRICVPYGNSCSKKYSYGTIGAFLNKVRKGENITLYGDGSLQRTFSHVNDICYQITNCVQRKESIGQIFNVAGESYSLKVVAEMFAAKYAVDIKYVQWPKEDWLIESGSTSFDNSKIDKLLDEHNYFSLRDFIQEIHE